MTNTTNILLPTGSIPVVPSARADPPFPWVGLITLSAAVFLSVTSEMLPTGLLPEMSRSLNVAQSQIGLLVSWFAFTVVLTSAPVAMLTRRLPRHGLIIAVLILFAVSNILTAIAPTYAFVIAARVLGGVAHGLFWAVVGAYAGHLVPQAQIGRAVSITVAGGTLAFVFGVPLGTAGGHLLGWRLSFVVLAALMLVGAVLVWKFLPPVARYSPGAPESAAATTTRQPRDATVPAVVLICIITGITMIGHYSFYTYIAPFLLDGLGVDLALIAPLLFAYGVAGAVGLLLVGTVLGPRPSLGLILGLAVSALSVTLLAVFTATLPVALVSFVLWGMAFGMLPPLLQTRMLHAASPRIRDTASAFYTTAFNAGIGGGALLGAVLIESVGLEMVPIVYVGLLVVALALVIVTDRMTHRRERA
ncbi:MAG: MFS transporter [Cryobacterium sp.]|uniref:MFS transporter n=1 Tax=unclassified Cryobacterium TaxID=2649013 RepID=UPI0018CB5DC9|nr:MULTISPECIES: MFS transporter [unclassified Cryobacterium]MCY7403541.1 MFS transporter [Cryobacterium sp.]MEC5153266.1 DHA1 family inner membrane transport protein [Cryobacterium sp. CAN_C3]